ncbi:hypothetical protein SAMN05421780_110162 [Flexibacter flexilis DSM 6793]|uniref:Phage abortive infection protein n=1 Tax=Flexibacter flexilis DSM 6793 TaxID=927664 RepID=A0A1I1MF30_9BACT|nr:hypothetical protein [Flexibacter flexilis]SFC84007.1 hypothetical protein SAMN05421780_110162 [Flexibacter flexilis DSM 6793]
MKKHNNWDTLMLIFSILAGIFFLISFIPPISLLIYSSFSSEPNFTKTGQIGDTIGGLMNPFIALAGVFVTFLAFYMQIRANKIQIDLFQEGLQNEKDVRESTERKDSYNKLKLLEADLANIEEDITIRAKNIKEYYEAEKTNPFKNNILKRTTPNKYARTLEIDRLGIFNGFSTFLKDEPNWQSDLSKLYNFLDLIPSYFDDVYTKADAYFNLKHEVKLKTANNINTFIQKLDLLQIKYEKEFNINKHPSKNPNGRIFQLKDTCKEVCDIYQETDFYLIERLVLTPFSNEIKAMTKNIDTFDLENLGSIIKLVSDIQQDIASIREYAANFVTSTEVVRQELVGENGYLSKVKSHRTTINASLNKIDPNKL